MVSIVQMALVVLIPSSRISRPMVRVVLERPVVQDSASAVRMIRHLHHLHHLLLLTVLCGMHATAIEQCVTGDEGLMEPVIFSAMFTAQEGHHPKSSVLVVTTSALVGVISVIQKNARQDLRVV